MLRTIAMFLFVFVAGTVAFIFKEIYLTGEFTVYHPGSCRFPVLVELVAACIILVIAISLFIKSLRRIVNGR